MGVTITGSVLFAVACAFFVAGYILGKRKGIYLGKGFSVLDSVERDAYLLGNGYLEIRRIDPMKIRIDGSNLQYRKKKQ